MNNNTFSDQFPARLSSFSLCVYLFLPQVAFPSPAVRELSSFLFGGNFVVVFREARNWVGCGWALENRVDSVARALVFKAGKIKLKINFSKQQQ